jgi:hypothetical protein
MKTQGIAGRYFLASSLIVVVSATCILFNSNSSRAATITIGVQPAGGAYQGWTLDSSKNGTYVEDLPNPNGVYGPDTTVDEWSGSSSNGSMKFNYDIHFDSDPTVTSFFSLQNTSGFTNTYTITVNQPVSPIVTSSLGSGSTGFTLTSVNPGSTLDTPVGSALYSAQINGITVKQLFPNGVSPLPFSTTTTGTINDSFSGQPEGPASSISIFNNFTLTNGDLVSATSIFKIDATNAPEPSSIVLSLLALVGAPLAMRRRRR